MVRMSRHHRAAGRSCADSASPSAVGTLQL